MQVLKLLAEGHNNRNILEKLHLHSQMQAVVWAVRERIFEQSRERETG
jgi:hypothetical protein